MDATGPRPPVTKWSFSGLLAYEKCPYSTYLKVVDKEPFLPPEPGSPLARGDQAHLEAENFVNGTGPFTALLSKFEKQFIQLKDDYAAGVKIELEQRWGFTREWAECSWSDPACWSMVKCDAVIHLDNGRHIRIIDYKTGKRWGNEVKHQQQLQIYTIAAFMRYPDAIQVTAELWYLDEGKPMVKTYLRPGAAVLLPRWEERADKMTRAMVFPPKPNTITCGYCPFGHKRGTGVCAYSAE